MAKGPRVPVLPGQPQSESGAHLKGALHVYWDSKRQRMIARSMPRTQGADTPARRASRSLFVQAQKLTRAPAAQEYDAAKALVVGTPFLPRDVLTKAAYGMLLIFRLQDGELFMGWRMAFSTIQLLLDSILNTPGSLLVRGPDDWLAITPGEPGFVLTIDAADGFPRWLDNAPNVQALLDSISDTPSDMLVRGPDGWISVAMSDVANIELLLDSISSTPGDMLVRGSTGWTVVPQGSVANIQTLLDSISSTAGDVLVRGVSTWSHVTAASLANIQTLLDSIGSAEGDLLVRGPSAWAVQAPGTAGYVLESGGAGALPQWVDPTTVVPSALANFHPGFVAGRFYESPFYSNNGTAAFSTGIIFAVPFFVPVVTTFTKLAFRTTGTFAGNAEMGVYSNVAGQPALPLYDGGSHAVTGNALQTVSGLNMLLNPGWYWLTLAFSANGNIIDSVAVNTGQSWLLGTTDANTTANALQGAWVYNAGHLPNPFPAASYVLAQAPRLLIGN